MHHGSARLTVHGRRTLVERVTEHGWSITKAAWGRQGGHAQTASKAPSQSRAPRIRGEFQSLRFVADRGVRV